MKIETTKKLILTKAEEKTIQNIFEILDNDYSLDIIGAWDILMAIYNHDSSIAQDYGYDIKIID